MTDRIGRSLFTGPDGGLSGISASLALAVLVTAVILFKASYLDLPYYWDEAWVYEPAVHAMRESGVSILPSALPPELSRGHPLLFHALATSWSLVFGDSRISLHAFALTTSLLLLLATYRLGAKGFSRAAGLCAALVLAVNEIFLAQSGLLLPEILLALFLVLAATAIVDRSTHRFTLWSTCALLTKESALAPIALLTAWICIEELAERSFRVGALTRVAPLLVPFLALGAFFSIQRLQHGWFLFPEHVDMISWSRVDIMYKGRLGFELLFEDQGMQSLLFAFSVAAPLLKKGLSWRWRLLIPFLYVVAIKVLWGRWPLPFIPSTIWICIALAGVFMAYRFKYMNDNRDRRTTILSSLIIICSLWSFASLNFYSERYLLPCVPFIAVGGVILVFDSLASWQKWLAPVVIAGSCVLMASQIGNRETTRDVDLAYADMIRMTRSRIAYSDSIGIHEAPIKASFVDVAYMTRHRSGYLPNEKVFKGVYNGPIEMAEYVFVNGPLDGDEAIAASQAGFHLLESFRSGVAQGSIHAR